EDVMLIQKAVQPLAAYGTAVVLSLCGLVVTLCLWRADIRIPFLYWHDTLVYDGLIKGMIDNGWFLENRFLGAPGTLRMHDFPIGENLHLGMLRLIAAIYPDHNVTLNVFFLLTFPLVTFSALFVFRHFGISYVPALG